VSDTEVQQEPVQESLDLPPASEGFPTTVTPADAAKKAAAKEPEAEEKLSRTPDQYESELSKLRKENAGWRTKLREAEPIIKAHQEAEEANKTELQREREAREALQRDRDSLQIGYTRLELAAQYNVSPDNIDLIGSGSREEMEDRAARLGALLSTAPAPPPSNRPVEGLRPGASPEPPKTEDSSYPANWGFHPNRS
jgi:hypothetical protein